MKTAEGIGNLFRVQSRYLYLICFAKIGAWCARGHHSPDGFGGWSDSSPISAPSPPPAVKAHRLNLSCKVTILNENVPLMQMPASLPTDEDELPAIVFRTVVGEARDMCLSGNQEPECSNGFVGGFYPL